MSMMLAEERKRRVLGIASTGRLIYAISGSEGDNDSGTGENNEGGKEGEGGQTGGTGEGGTQTTEQPQMVSREEYETLVRRLQAADKAKGEFEKELRGIRDAEKSELEKAQARLKELEEAAAQAKAEALQAKLANEILKFPGFVWHNPEAVLKLVDMEMISVDEESGKVSGVKDALNKLAKDHSYLLKGKQGDKKDGDGKAGTNGASGHNPGGQGDTTDKNKNRERLAKKYKL